MFANIRLRVSGSIILCIGSCLILGAAVLTVTGFGSAAAYPSYTNYEDVFCGTAPSAFREPVVVPPHLAPLVVDVSIFNNAFDPPNLTINVGDTVRWTNNHVGRTHTATSDTADWDSGNLATGQSFSFTFNDVGSFPYHCNIHGFMTASITVQEPSPTISGMITYGNPVTGPNPRGVPNVLLSADGVPPVSDTTGATGTYSLTGFGKDSYTITPSKSGGVNGAITGFDAAKIAQYATGATSLTAAQLIVADVSGVGGVSSFDASLIARYAASLGPPNGSTGTWNFSPTSNTHESITSVITGENYSALLMGDVTGNWGDPSPFRSARGPEKSTSVALPNLTAPADNKEIIIPVSVQGAANKGILSYEFDLRYDPSVIQPQANPVDVKGTVSRGFVVVANPNTPGLLRVVIYGALPIGSVDGYGVLLNLKFTAVGKPGSVSPLIWERIMFNEGYPLTLASDGQIELEQNR